MKNIVFISLMIFLISEISFAFGEQGDWRWRNDDGDVYSATWKDSLNFPAVIPTNYEDNIRLRVKFLHYTNPLNIYLQYSDRPGYDPWIPVNNVDTGKFFISQSSYITDTMSYFENQLLPPVTGYPYSRTITFDSSYNYDLVGESNSAYELEYSLKTASDLESGKAYFFSLFTDSGSISLPYLEEYPVLLIPPVFWNTQNSGTTEILYGVSTIGLNKGWIVGLNGKILHTTNGGDTWIPESGGTANALHGVSFIDENNGWIAGSYGTILHTTDGGINWIYQTSGTTTNLLAVSFADVNNGWTVGYNGTILHTTNGGDIWTAQSSGTTYVLQSNCFIDADNGWTVGLYGTILHTTNGGDTWIPESGSTTNSLYGVSFIDENNGWAVGYYGTILHTTNGGDTWISESGGGTTFLTGVSFVDENTGWAVGYSGTILKTTDGGATWDFQTSGTMRDLKAISFAHVNNGVVVGNAGKILGTTNGDVPVELTSFTAASIERNVLLNWSTATEINNQGFEMQRSSGNSEYTRIGFVEGNGSSSEGHIYSYTDKNLNNGKYYYRLKQMDFDGGYEYSDVAEVTVNAPIEFSLQQNYPNPFNPATTIEYSIPEKSHVILKVYDILGSEIGTLINEEKQAGIYKFTWNAVNLPSGIYFYQLKAGSYTETRKMIMMK